MKLHDLNPPILEIPKQERWHRMQRIKAIKCSTRYAMALSPLAVNMLQHLWGSLLLMWIDCRLVVKVKERFRQLYQTIN